MRNGLALFGLILAAFVVLAYFIHIADAYLLVMLAISVVLIGASGLPYWRTP